MDETDIFYHTTENKILHQESQECSVGKKAKRQLTIFTCTIMVSDKKTP